MRGGRFFRLARVRLRFYFFFSVLDMLVPHIGFGTAHEGVSGAQTGRC
jgi:hypothetical protein